LDGKAQEAEEEKDLFISIGKNVFGKKLCQPRLEMDSSRIWRKSHAKAFPKWVVCFPGIKVLKVGNTKFVVFILMKVKERQQLMDGRNVLLAFGGEWGSGRSWLVMRTSAWLMTV
jgi:hypothetical protein